MQKFTRVSLSEGVFGSKLGLEFQTGNEITVPLRNGRESALILQLNFYYLNPVAKMDRFLGQPKFAGKTYMKFESQPQPGIKAENQAGIKASCFRKSSS